ncbi:chromate transporter [Mesobacillus subterraneus]|uniref:Chromate transporter n=1 Tax=Mesobacillus subterraneus TaxID=285983 RepID=A0A0D6ZD99_9BACI|nr:chromate transporter [Mesobacillus subterraneus]KIY23774.1 chromate transporter [Mesobacillus subterraneus]
MILINLSLLFLFIGVISFGGGFAMIPVIEAEVTKRGWLTTSEYTDIIAVAGMAPGSIASNSATLVGYHVAGVPGAIVSSIAITFPSLILILLIAVSFNKINQSPLFHSIFYGLRPIVTGLILFAAIKFAISNGLIASTFSWQMVILLSIFALSLFVLLYYKAHPVLVILASGIVGAVIFS